jgi:hypothetical protein
VARIKLRLLGNLSHKNDIYDWDEKTPIKHPGLSSRRPAFRPTGDCSPCPNFSLEIRKSLYIGRVSFLTKQEQMVLCLVMLLLLTGWAVKTYRAAHPAPISIAPPAQKL